MSMQLMQYLLADARDVRDSGPSPYEGESNLVLALQRHGPSHLASRDKTRNRLSLDLERVLAGAHTSPSSPTAHRDSRVAYRRAGSDLVPSVTANRRSLNLDLLSSLSPSPGVARLSPKLSPSAAPPRRAVHFNIPDSPEAARRFLQGQSYRPGTEALKDAQRRRTRERHEDPPSDVEATGAPSHRIKALLDITPKDYAEAQRLKKMLKRAVSRPDTTFEDLKAYRQGMKRLRRIVREEQEREIQQQAQQQREEHLQQQHQQKQRQQLQEFMDKLSSPSYTSRYGSNKDTSNTPTVSYRSAVTRDLSAAQDRLQTGYTSGSGGSYSRYGSGGDNKITPSPSPSHAPSPAPLPPHACAPRPSPPPPRPPLRPTPACPPPPWTAQATARTLNPGTGLM
ncbi:protein enabled homolog isoform X2 [Scylla paramamosain]|uniref:protein enabled homolog isoform X2 n=1 Tax=Scylla paramamosain TaxID=85552 RepID=UPI00308391D8